MTEACDKVTQETNPNVPTLIANANMSQSNVVGVGVGVGVGIGLGLALSLDGVMCCMVVWVWVRCGAVWCGVPKALLPKGNGRDGLVQAKMQAGRVVCLSADCVWCVAHMW